MKSCWLMRNRTIATKSTSPEESFRLDSHKTANQNAQAIFTGLCNQTISDSLRMSYLLEAAQLFDKTRGLEKITEYTVEQFLKCVSLVHQNCQVRAGALRAIRYLLATSEDVRKFHSLQLHFLVCRSLDIVLQNEEERMQAVKLSRRMIALAADQIGSPLVNCLVALAHSKSEDRILRAYLATLCELSVLNSDLFIECGGVGVITKNALETQTPRIAESLVGTLLHLLERPHTRRMAGVQLDAFAAAYCEASYHKMAEKKGGGMRESNKRSSVTLMSVLKSWPGIIEFCNPHNSTGLKAIIDMLYINQGEARKAILDLIYEAVGQTKPPATDDYAVALQVVDPADFQDSWRLSDGFVAFEGRSVLPSLAQCVPNIFEIHLSLLLYCLVENGLLNALVQVIITSEPILSVRATILLGKMLQLMHTLLPVDVYNTNHYLPTLIMKAAEGNHQAKAAITALQSYHIMLRNRPASCTLFLDTIIQSGKLIETRMFNREISSTKEGLTLPKKRSTLDRHRRRYNSVGSSSLSEETIGETKESKFRTKILHIFEHVKENERMIRESYVLTGADKTWDWDLIVTLFRSELLTKMDELTSKFIRVLVAYFKPSNNRFSHEELMMNRQIPAFVIAGLDLIDWLLKSSPELDCIRLLTDLFTDISSQLLSISTARSVHDCLFSPQHMASTMCQQYFLFIGRMCKHEQGISVLNNTGVFKQLSNLVSNTNHICYVKLIVSGLDYKSTNPQKILALALTKSSQRDARHYATQFMLVLMRAKIPGFEVWGIRLLMNQLRDKERLVHLTALDILLEACHDRLYLEEIILCWPVDDMTALGDIGRLVITKFYSLPRGLNHPKAQIAATITEWVSVYNKKYVLIVEEDTHAILTLHERNEDKTYSKRTFQNRPTILPPNILPHLYGQLVQTVQGMTALQKYGDFNQHLETLQNARCESDIEILNLKAALWAIGHISTHSEGVKFINDPVSRVYEKIIYLARNSPTYSIRATAINALALVGTTKDGADALYKLDWLCVRQTRNSHWPVQQPEDWLSYQLTPVHHQIGPVPPYNYTTLYEINGLLNSTLEEISSFYCLDPNETTLDESTDATDTPSPLQQKSQTLPDKNLLARQMKSKHLRSMSESKTADSLMLKEHMHRKRFNSGTTDSNTSGTSSCDSFVIRLGGDQHTLSPIPSSSNLIECFRPKPRRISVTGVPINDNGPSLWDIQGVNTFRSIRRNRPALDVFNDVCTVPETSEDPKKSPTTLQPKAKSLDRHSTISSYEEFRSTLVSARRLQTNDTKGPCYLGICLPKYINDLFPKWSPPKMYVRAQEPDEIEIKDVNESTSDISQSSKKIVKDETPEKSSGQRLSPKRRQLLAQTGSEGKFGKKHEEGECLFCIRNSRPNSRVSRPSPMETETETERTMSVPEKILEYVKNMVNFGFIKQSLKSLLDLKQKHPEAFQDMCLYSEVSRELGRNTYKANTRRLVQEFFYDLNFDAFYADLNEILTQKALYDDAVLQIVEAPTESSIGDTTAAAATTTTHKSHFLAFSPFPLERVSEASQENLSESLTKSTKSALHVPSTGEAASSSSNNSSNSKNKQQQFHLTATETANLNTSNLNSSTSTSFSKSESSWMMPGAEPRPRFNSLDLDLSCTKNKFPIRDRSKLSSSKDLTPQTPEPTVKFTSFNRPPSDQGTAPAMVVTTPTGILFCEQRLLGSDRDKEKK